jgi:hypothetical protein
VLEQLDLLVNIAEVRAVQMPHADSLFSLLSMLNSARGDGA